MLNLGRGQEASIIRLKHAGVMKVSSDCALHQGWVLRERKFQRTVKSDVSTMHLLNWLCHMVKNMSLGGAPGPDLMHPEPLVLNFTAS
eukprot:scaffold61037_cov13-Tisochrysis_lutea.AAC.1